MIHELENETIILRMKEGGAELTSVMLKSDGTEYIWQGDPAYWGRHAPVLFPIVGRLVNDTYLVDLKSFHLTQHGFARDMMFKVTNKSEKSIRFVLNSTKGTLEHYPFPFELSITYILEDNSVVVIYSVHNIGDKEMFFSVGAHPAFNCPMNSGETFEDYYLEFGEIENLETYILEDGYRQNSKRKIAPPSKTLPLAKSLFKDDAIILEEMKENKISIRSNRHERFVQVEFPDFPFIGIWTPYNKAPFLCIEPWQGLADEIGHPVELSKKKGILPLESGGTYTGKFKITVG
ncbi:aldose 1-epimerase family protein [Metabacillus arenae]|uniref:Aldose 1-epimerase family protein n=1 Tax=Metabacillus arenae TaxID=2771434 RepID=A0A926RVV7_9BACI|nr:aldose 1-epimerase family protein [Metabacillus arenae]MBD1380118.1 aldose 1-epimerase family protein [Metabacillus arenae]